MLKEFTTPCITVEFMGPMDSICLLDLSAFEVGDVGQAGVADNNAGIPND